MHRWLDRIHKIVILDTALLDSAVVYEQMYPETKFIYVHSYASKHQATAILLLDAIPVSKIIGEKLKYLCVTIILKLYEISSVSTPGTTKCFIRSLKRTAWMTNNQQQEDYHV